METHFSTPQSQILPPDQVGRISIMTISPRSFGPFVLNILTHFENIQAQKGQGMRAVPILCVFPYSPGILVFAEIRILRPFRCYAEFNGVATLCRELCARRHVVSRLECWTTCVALCVCVCVWQRALPVGVRHEARSRMRARVHERASELAAGAAIAASQCQASKSCETMSWSKKTRSSRRLLTRTSTACRERSSHCFSASGEQQCCGAGHT